MDYLSINNFLAAIAAKRAIRLPPNPNKYINPNPAIDSVLRWNKIEKTSLIR